MISNTDFEKFWFRYQTDGIPKGITINSFCQQNGVSYNEFEKWYKRTHRTIEKVEVIGQPQSEVQPPKISCKHSSNGRNCGSGIHVTIKTRDGLFIQKGNLDLQGLKLLVERLEGLC